MQVTAGKGGDLEGQFWGVAVLSRHPFFLNSMTGHDLPHPRGQVGHEAEESLTVWKTQ